MRFTTFLAIVAVAVGSAAADTTSAGCIERNGVQICSGNNTPPVISVAPGGCSSIEIGGVQFCNTTALGTSTVRTTSTHTVATAHTTPTTQAAATTTPATGDTNSTTQAASTAMVVTGATNSTVRTTATGAVATPSTTSSSTRIASLSHPFFFLFCFFVAFSSA